MSGDSVFYENGLMPVDDNEYFSGKQWLYILDQNGGSYNSGFIQFDGSALANNSNYLNWSEAYFSIPFVVAVDSTAGFGAGTGVAVDPLIGLKNGYFSIINSMSCKLGGKDMLNLTPYLNQFVSYKLLTSFSTNDLSTLGDSLGFWPDTSTSVTYSTTKGTQNNIANLVSYTPALAYSGTTNNAGFLRRILNTAYDPSNGTNAGLNSISTSTATSKNYTKFWQSATPNLQTQVYYIDCIIRLKDISDLFNKLDMPMKGLYCQFQLNLNQGQIEVPTASLTPTNASVQGNTFPVMLNQQATILGGVNAGTMTLICSVGSVTVNGSTFKGNQSSCRLYVPQYNMIASAERKYLESGKVKNIIYDDLQVFQVLNTPGGQQAQINQILTNGIANPKKLVICPTLNAAANITLSPLSPFLSPNSSEPSTTSPVIDLSNMQILLSGQSIFNNVMQYNYEFFLNETRPNSVLNGGLTDGISTGLIGELDWYYLYRYYVFNLSRYGKPESKNVPLSVQLQCQNFANVAIDLNCFITYERQVKIDISNGLVE